MKKKVAVVVIIVGVLVTIIGYVMGTNGWKSAEIISDVAGYTTPENQSIVIIGGADGPTSIFIASKTGDFTWPIIGILIVLVGLIVLFVSKKKKS